MKQDWTLGTYALSGTLPLVIFIAYDEIDRLYSLRDMVLLTILMITMAIVYLRARSARRRRLSLVVSILAILGYTTVSTTVYWRSLGPENVFIPGMIGWVLILVLFYFSPAIPSVWKRIVNKRASES
jgi:amino acid transporter